MTSNVTPSTKTTSPGALLRRARESRGLGAHEVADQLNWLPAWVKAIEADEYQVVRNLAFARGYVRAYGRLMELAEPELMSLFDDLLPGEDSKKEPDASPAYRFEAPHLAMAAGVTVLLLLALWLLW